MSVNDSSLHGLHGLHDSRPKSVGLVWWLAAIWLTTPTPWLCQDGSTINIVLIFLFLFFCFSSSSSYYYKMVDFDNSTLPWVEQKINSQVLCNVQYLLTPELTPYLTPNLTLNLTPSVLSFFKRTIVHDCWKRQWTPVGSWMNEMNEWKCSDLKCIQKPRVGLV